MNGDCYCSVLVQGMEIRVSVEIKQRMNISSSSSEDGNNVAVILKTRTI
jgi:hypothetical protein